MLALYEGPYSKLVNAASVPLVIINVKKLTSLKLGVRTTW